MRSVAARNVDMNLKPDIKDEKELRPLLTIPYVLANGTTLNEMRDNFINSAIGRELYAQGNCVLIWVNDGDIAMQEANIWIYNENLKKGTLFDPDDGV